MNIIDSIIWMVILLFLGIATGYNVKEFSIKKRAIEMDYGFYHPKTGYFQWKDSYLPYITGIGEDKNED